MGSTKIQGTLQIQMDFRNMLYTQNCNLRFELTVHVSIDNMILPRRNWMQFQYMYYNIIISNKSTIFKLLTHATVCVVSNIGEPSLPLIVDIGMITICFANVCNAIILGIWQADTLHTNASPLFLYFDWFNIIHPNIACGSVASVPLYFHFPQIEDQTKRYSSDELVIPILLWYDSRQRRMSYYVILTSAKSAFVKGGVSSDKVLFSYTQHFLS